MGERRPIDDAWNGYDRLRNELRFIGQQGCQRYSVSSCSELGRLCVTEYCLACYAKAVAEKGADDGE